MKPETLKWHVMKADGEDNRYALLVINEKESMGMRLEFTRVALTKFCKGVLKTLAKG